MSAKQKIVHSRGPSNINLGIFVCSFDICRLYSYSHPVKNYVQTDLGTLTREPIISKACYIRCDVHSFLKKKQQQQQQQEPRYPYDGFQIHHSIYCRLLDE